MNKSTYILISGLAFYSVRDSIKILCKNKCIVSSQDEPITNFFSLILRMAIMVEKVVRVVDAAVEEIISKSFFAMTFYLK